MAGGIFAPGVEKPRRPRRKNLGKIFRGSPRTVKRRQVDRQARREFMDSPYGQNTLTGREAVEEARRAAGYKYGAADRMLGREIRQSPQQHKTIDTAFNLYTQKLGALAQQTNAAYSQAQQAAYNQANQDTAQVQQGAVGSELSGQVANAAAVRNANTVNYGGMIGAQGASQFAYQTDQRRIGELERIGSHARETAYGRELRAKRRDVKKERGQYRGEVLRQIKDDERRWTLEQVAFEIDKYQARLAGKESKQAARDARRDDKRAVLEALLDAKADRRDDMRQRLKDRWDMTDDQIDNAIAQQRENRMGRGGGGGWTPTKRKEFKRYYNRGVSMARRLGTSKIRQVGTRRAIDDLTEKLNGERPLARAAILTALYGGVPKQMRNRIRRQYGISVPLKPSYGGSANPIVEGVDNLAGDLLG